MKNEQIQYYPDRSCEMANLQVKGIDDALYEQVKRLAASENRSVSQEMIFLVKSHLARQKRTTATPSPAEILLQLAGSWEDSRSAEEIIADNKKSRRNSSRLSDGL